MKGTASVAARKRLRETQETLSRGRHEREDAAARVLRANRIRAICLDLGVRPDDAHIIWMYVAYDSAKVYGISMDFDKMFIYVKAKGILDALDAGAPVFAEHMYNTIHERYKREIAESYAEKAEANVEKKLRRSKLELELTRRKGWLGTVCRWLGCPLEDAQPDYAPDRVSSIDFQRGRCAWDNWFFGLFGAE